ncbi:MAG: class I SAM-dependent DNA methyltransferase, partial [Anaerolineae bacterium]|nr:class I SAM-dependent DNA methyltransferase [Anaerolineae bacterium]
MPDLTPQQFVEKWDPTRLKEKSSYQEHFLDLCRLVGFPTPAEADPDGDEYSFEYGVKKIGGSQGWADVAYVGRFAIEYKGKEKPYATLDEAYQQLLQYRENLHNPPLLAVCDIENWIIHTNWPGTVKKTYRFSSAEIVRPHVQRWLRALLHDQQQLHPLRTAEEVTADAADVFKAIASNMRAWEAAPGRIARFLTKLVFCLFAEDVGLLPTVEGRGIFTTIVEQSRQRPDIFKRYLGDLFRAMQDGGDMLFQQIRWFNGRLFENIDVEELSLEALTALERACHLDWSSVEPAIFGTLFER